MLIVWVCVVFVQRSVPVCNSGDCVKGCGVCGAFMSPAMSWQDCGQRFYCPFCGKLTEGMNRRINQTFISSRFFSDYVLAM